MSYTEVNGDLIKLAKRGEFDVIGHGCNCFCTMGAGIAPQMAEAFDCDSFKWMGKEFHLPMKIERYSDKIRISEYFNNPLPIEFNNEEEARFVLNVLDVAINPYK